jgi:hypothetical protein
MILVSKKNFKQIPSQLEEHNIRTQYQHLKNSLIIHEENTKKNHKRVVSVYVIQIHVDLHKL